MISGKSIYRPFAEYIFGVAGDVTTGFGSECLWFIPGNLPCNVGGNKKNDVMCDESHAIDSPVSCMPSKKAFRNSYLRSIYGVGNNWIFAVLCIVF